MPYLTHSINIQSPNNLLSTDVLPVGCKPEEKWADVELSGSVDVRCTCLLFAVHGVAKIINFTPATHSI